MIKFSIQLIGGEFCMRCSVYIRNKKEGASCYYRIIQYTNKINNVNYKYNNLMTDKMYRNNLDCKNKYVKKFLQLILYLIMCFRVINFLLHDFFNKPEIIIIQRTTLPRYTPMIIKMLLFFTLKKTYIIWDFDDDIFLSGEISKFESKLLSKNSNKIIVTSEYLMNKLDSSIIYKVILLPTTDGDFQDIDIVEMENARTKDFKDELKMVWVATSSNIPSLVNVITDLDNAAQVIKHNYNKDLILYVVCNSELNYHTDYLCIKNIKWSRKKAREIIIKSHIGIMPLLNNDYSLGKGGFKLIQYMSTGLPVIASNIGFNKKVIDKSCGILINDKENSDQWIEALLKMGTDINIWRKYSMSSYKRWLNNFSFQYNLLTWKKLITEIIKKKGENIE